MPILNKKDIYSGGNPVDELIGYLEKLLDVEKKLTEQNKLLSTALQSIKKSNDGTEAKKLIAATNQLAKSTTNLKEVKLASQRVNEQILKNNARLAESATKEAVALEKVKLQKQQNVKASKELARAELGLIQPHERLTKKTNEAQLKFKNLAAQFGVNSKQAKKAKKEFDKLEKELSSVNRAAKDGRRDVGRYSAALKGVGGQLVGALGITAGITALVGVAKNAAKVFVGFEKSSSSLAAILGKTKTEIKSLIVQAKELGSSTAFTAKQVIEADTALAKLGFTTEQIEQSIPGVLNLAAATGTDLAQSAELAASTLRIFNLDASEMGRVSDVLAKSTTISSLSMEKLATILPTVGKTAQIAGVSLERTAALAGTLTDRGLDASSAATSLRNIFLELSKKGLTWEQAMEKVNSSTDKNKTSMELFGKRAAAAGVILSETASSTDNLVTSLENADGAAQRMSETMLDNLAGDITIAQSAWEGFILSVEDGDGVISTAIRGIVTSITDLLTVLTKINKGESFMLQLMKKQNDFDQVIKSSTEKLKYETDLQERSIDKLNSAIMRVRQQMRGAFGDEARTKELKGELMQLKAQLAAIKAKNFEEERGTKINNELLRRKKKLSENLRLLEEEEAKFFKDDDKILQIQYANEKLKEEIVYLEEIRDGREGKNKIIEEEVEIVNKLTAAQKRQLREERELSAERDRRSKITGEPVEEISTAYGATEVSGGFDPVASAVKTTEDVNKNIADVQKGFDDAELKRLYELEEAKKSIKDSFINEVASFASDVFAQEQDAKLARVKSDIEAEKKLAQDKLDKGLINEIQFNTKISELNKKERNAEAKAAKKKALFDIAINTAVGIVKALPDFLSAAVVAATGAIQALLVAARPIPKYAEGTESVKLNGNKKGKDTILAWIDEGERIVPKNTNKQLGGIPNEALPEVINRGLFRDIDVNKTVSQKSYDFNILSSKLDKINNTNRHMLEVSKGQVSEYTLGNVKYIRFGNGQTYKEVING